MSKKDLKKVEVRPNSTFNASDISARGIKAIFGGVRLNWVFVATPKVDDKDPLKAQYRLQAILGSGEKEFVAGLKKACEQYLTAASVAWGGDVRQKVLKQQFTLDVDKSFFKTTEQGLIINAHSTVKRDSVNDTFAAKFPPKLLLENGESPASVAEAEKAFYSGIYADVAVWIQAYEVEGGRGLSVYLNGVRKLADGDPIAGSIDPFAGTQPTALPAAMRAKALL